MSSTRFPGQIGGNRKSRVPLSQPVDLVVALDTRAVRQLKAVIPALLGEFLAEVHAPAGFVHTLDYLRRGGGAKFHKLWKYSINEKRSRLYWRSPEMSTPFQIVVCGSLVPDPLQTLEPVTGPAGPSLKNEMMLPAVLDPWAGHALFEAANLAQKNTGQQGVAGQPGRQGQAAAGDDDRGAEGRPSNWWRWTVRRRASPIPSRRRRRWPRRSKASPGWTARRLLLFGGWESASRGAGATMQMVGERLGHHGAVPGRGPDRGPRRRQLRSPGAGRRRAPPGVGVRGAAGGARLGHRQPARAAQQSAGRAWPTCGP